MQRRPGNLRNLSGSWLGNIEEKLSKHKPLLHPEIYKYNPKFIEPLIRRRDYKKGIKEIGEQIYTFELFTPEYCKKLLREAEHHGGWETSEDKEFGNFGLHDLLRTNHKTSELDTTLSLADIPVNNTSITEDGDARQPGSGKLNAVYVDIVKRHIEPLITQLWTTYRIGKIDQPYLLKYSPNNVKKMNLHYDREVVTLVVYLNNEFTGGGTYFPRWDKLINPQKPGTAIVYPGGVSHEHLGLPIKSGVRYLFCGAFY